MLSLITITTTHIPSAVLAAQGLLDHVQATIQSEAAKVVAGLATMDFDAYTVPGPMLTGAWDGACD